MTTAQSSVPLLSSMKPGAGIENTVLGRVSRAQPEAGGAGELRAAADPPD